VVYGFLGRFAGEDTRRRVKETMELKLNGMRIDCYTDFGVVALSSLTDDPIENSDHMLLSTIGRARNSGAEFDGEKMVDVGHAPIMSELIEADISVQTTQENLRVWAVNSDGYYVGMLETRYEDGWLHFSTGKHFPAQYYLISAE